ncbi:MAG: rhamnan synthesis F family protein [Aquabacterium sp.]|nr:rhamnan synthesis F family protein [Aquabacterium sp.]
MPFVRRREYRKVQQQYSSLVDGVGWKSHPVTDAKITALKPLVPAMNGDVCFFVTFAVRGELKVHVRWHIEHLLRSGIKVVLIVNTELPHSSFSINPDLAKRLSGAFIRQNFGFDFAAWAHLYHLCTDRENWTRLFLVNDSIVGPLDAAAFDTMIERIRASRADFVGLTQSKATLLHLQSYFLVFQTSALRSAALSQVFQRIVCLPSKDQVIAVYETQLTQRLAASGLSFEALFPQFTDSIHADNDTYYRWDKLVQVGFPFVKVVVLKMRGNSALVSRLVPSHLLEGETLDRR